MMFNTRTKGDNLIIQFNKPISSSLRARLRHNGFHCYCGEWWGKEHKQEMIDFLRSWVQTMPRKCKPTICWECKNAVGYCEWSEDFKPVDGWDAEKTEILVINQYGQRTKTDSYIVHKCPKFEKG